uniref:Uncharacterized protein n=1 Tax=Trypanosoma congolense (strain IL3000) TaxID=1068625 RepID=G0UMC6_TRYCI|nr:hypothetical protein, unlikely [Trypanosoma congolense IL3000]
MPLATSRPLTAPINGLGGDTKFHPPYCVLCTRGPSHCAIVFLLMCLPPTKICKFTRMTSFLPWHAPLCTREVKVSRSANNSAKLQ